MPRGIIVGQLDVAELVFYAFVLFFIGLVFYLRREDRREGYPLEDATTGRVDSAFGPLTASTSKSFRMPFGQGIVTTPTKGREPVDIAATRIDRFPGAPYAPTGNPLADGIGPAAYAERARTPDYDAEGRPRIVPLAAEPHFTIARKDVDPRGLPVVGADGAVAGTVAEVWIDRADRLIRYLEINVGSGTVLAPMAMAKVERRKRRIVLDALNAAQFAAAPRPAAPAEITRYEEERVVAYFGGGYLYANRSRQEPWL